MVSMATPTQLLIVVIWAVITLAVLCVAFGIWWKPGENPEDQFDADDTDEVEKFVRDTLSGGVGNAGKPKPAPSAPPEPVVIRPECVIYTYYHSVWLDGKWQEMMFVYHFDSRERICKTDVPPRGCS